MLALLVLQFVGPAVAGAVEASHQSDHPAHEVHFESQGSEHCEPAHDHGACQVARTLGQSLGSDNPTSPLRVLPVRAASVSEFADATLDSRFSAGPILTRGPPSV